MGHNSLALRINLKHHAMKVETGCVMCGHFDEDGAHLFFKCKCVKSVQAVARTGERYPGGSSFSNRTSGGSSKPEAGGVATGDRPPLLVMV